MMLRVFVRPLLLMLLLFVVVGCQSVKLDFPKNAAGQFVGGDPRQPSSTWPVISNDQRQALGANIQPGTVFLGDEKLASTRIGLLYVKGSNSDIANEEAKKAGMQVKESSQQVPMQLTIDMWVFYYAPAN